MQASKLPAPVYRVRNVRGPQHDPTFEVEALVGETVVGVGEGRSKRLAERAAATAALAVEVSVTAPTAPTGAPPRAEP